jgi:hypothetical protein
VVLLVSFCREGKESMKESKKKEKRKSQTRSSRSLDLQLYERQNDARAWRAIETRPAAEDRPRNIRRIASSGKRKETGTVLTSSSSRRTHLFEQLLLLLLLLFYFLAKRSDFRHDNRHARSVYEEETP